MKAFWPGIAVLLIAITASAQLAPDLTKVDLSTIDTTRNYNLGPTGMRGWIYVDYDNGDVNAINGTMTSQEPWQILVTAVGTNTPSEGILDVDDVILGVNTGLGNLPVPLFTNDARRSIGWAIGDAEAGDGWMNIKRFRAGVTSDVSIQLELQGLAYSSTAPYNCPKSSVILSNAIEACVGQTMNMQTPGNQWLGLAMLASDSSIFNPTLQDYARSIPMPVSITQALSDHSLRMWHWSYDTIFLAEYHMKTGDTNVLPKLSQYVLTLANAQSRYGTYGHDVAQLNNDFSYNGTIAPYGPVNQVGLAASLGLVLGRKSLQAAGWPVDTAITEAIYRSKRFYGYYVQKGNVPYGEHEPLYTHTGNGKEGLSALMFGMMGGHPEETKYWTRITLAGHRGRESGHSGQAWSYVWGPLGVALGGTNAVAAYFKEIRWHLDLARRSDGSFIYDGKSHYGCSAIDDYWAPITYHNTYYGSDPTSYFLLTYALPRAAIYLTGRDADAANTLDTAAVSDSIEAGYFFMNLDNFTTNELHEALSAYDPLVRRYAAQELGTRPGVSVDGMIELAGSTNAWLRQSACEVLGVLGDTRSLGVLAESLSDPDIWVRAKAAKALREFDSAGNPVLSTMMTAFINNATDPNSVDWTDPVQIANGILSFELFGDAVYYGPNVAGYTISAPKELLYPALAAALRQPDSNPRKGACRFAYDRLELEDVQALATNIIEAAAAPSQADTMWCHAAQAEALKTLGKHNCSETIRLALETMDVPYGYYVGEHVLQIAALEVLADYGDAARWVLPSLQDMMLEYGIGADVYSALSDTIDSISAAVTAPTMTHLFPVAAPQVVATTDTTPITLSGYSCRTNAVDFLNVTDPAHGTLHGTAPSLDLTLNPGYSGVDRFFFEVSDGTLSSEPATVSIIAGAKGSGLVGSYYDNSDFTNLKFTRIDPQIDFDWGAGSPSNSIAPTTFSVRWEGLLLAPESGMYSFSTLASGGVRLSIDDTTVIDDWDEHIRQWQDSSSVYLTAGNMYAIQLELTESGGDAVERLKWHGPSFAGSNGVVISSEWLYEPSTVPDSPLHAYSQNITMVSDTSKNILLGGYPAASSFQIVSNPAHGDLDGTPPNMTYTPYGGYAGEDVFSFAASDGINTSEAANVTINVMAGWPDAFDWVSSGSGNWSSSGNWMNNGAGAAPDATGQPYYTLNFTNKSTYTASQDLDNYFTVNQINLDSAVTIAGNALTLTSNGTTQPSVNQHGTSEARFSTPIELGAMTTLGGLEGGDIVLSGLISGPGGLTVTTPSQVKIEQANNTYQGGTVVEAGSLVVDMFPATTITPFGLGPLTLKNSAMLRLGYLTLTNALWLSGGFIDSINGFGTILSGPVTVDATARIVRYDHWSVGPITFSGDIVGPGGFWLDAQWGITFSGSNTYEGTCTIANGEVTYSKAESVGAGRLIINEGATANLAFSGTRTISGLTLNGVNQPNGVYGSMSSTAENKSSCFVGNGLLSVEQQNVTTNHSVPYSWLASCDPTWTIDAENSIMEDHDGDGYATWQEYWAGTDPNDSSSHLKIDEIYIIDEQLYVKWRHSNPDPTLPPIAIFASTNLNIGWEYMGQKSPEHGTNTWNTAPSDKQFFRLMVTVDP
ncbi:hypothetical protein BVX97_01075 [bacterium E08(2017)]|nr:hypothetical protein BVX97_01075 [bacterium E08(2017)]